MNISEEKDYCLNCKMKPCQKGCPLNNDIPYFINEKDSKRCFEILCETTVLPSICGRVCAKDRQCESKCIRGIKSKPVNIGIIETWIGDKSLEENYKIPKKVDVSANEYKNNRIAIIGGGPSGITAAAFLARAGFKVTIYEKHEKLGGILRYGIPEFRLSKKIVDKTIEKILEIGNIDVKCNVTLGKNLKLSDIEEEYDAILLAFGANVSSKMNIEGENLEGVYGANEILEYYKNFDMKNKNVAVVGGGNVAIDMARTAKKNGARKVSIIYRRSEEEMPADKKEIEEARKENIEFLFQNNIIKILPSLNNCNRVGTIECIKTELVKKEGNTRLYPVNIENSNYLLEKDLVFMAIGSKVDEKTIKDLNISLDKYNNIIVDDKYRTSNKKVFACGDLIGQEATVAWASMTGREAAKNIIKFLI